MSEIVLTKQHKTAIELNQKILITAQAAQQNLYDMCVMLKQMRDDKLYKELGYQNFEDYCESEVGFSRMNAHRYISIIENVKNVTSMLHCGTTKLALLATLSEPEQEEIQQTVNLEDTSVRELKAEIVRLKAEHKQEVKELSDENTGLQSELAEANEKITELENRPVEVAVREDPEAAKKIEELNRKLMDESIQKSKERRKSSELEERIKKAEKELADLKDINKMQEQRIRNSELAAVSPDTKEVFRAYYQNSINAMQAVMGFISDAKAKNDTNLDFFKAKLDVLVAKFGENLNKIWE